jgi:hypothetical protein
MAEFVGKVGSGLLDLSATSLADLPHLDGAVLEIAVDRLIKPCGDVTNMSPVSGGARMWQNYSTAH